MGRRAKFLTVDEVAAGHCERTHRYNQGLRPQLEEKYEKQHQNIQPASIAASDPRRRQPGVARPQDLAMADVPASRGRGALPRCSAWWTGPGLLPLDIWMVEPPFADDDDTRDPQSLWYISFTHNSRIALHGLRLQQEQADDVRRRAAFATEGEAAHQEELRELQSRWARVMALPAYPVNSRKYAMWIHYTNWLARTIYRLYHLEFLN
ncbi:hypothetical protein B0H13DRAFT_2349882 [Mycena leptocephala]|nr:hypothetical protein B0H13DRAFT_2349882 [Mycena leptocephala]